MAKLTDGFQTTITFGTAVLAHLFNVSLTPPGVSAEGAIDTTTMSNTAWRTMAAKSLKTATEASGTAAYDVAAYDEIATNIGLEQSFTITFPDSSTLQFYGFLDQFTPGELTEGEMPTADFTIIPTNVNSNTGAESGPDYIEPT